MKWNIIDAAFLLLPNNTDTSKRMAAERSLIHAGFGSKLNVYMYDIDVEIGNKDYANWEAHRKISLFALDQKYKNIAVFEEDCRFLVTTQDKVNHIEKEIKNLPTNWRLYLLANDANFFYPLNDHSHRILSSNHSAYIASVTFMDWFARLTPDVYKIQPIAKLIAMTSDDGFVSFELAIKLSSQIYGIVPPVAVKKGNDNDNFIDGASSVQYGNPFLLYAKLTLNYILVNAIDYVGFYILP